MHTFVKFKEIFLMLYRTKIVESHEETPNFLRNWPIKPSEPYRMKIVHLILFLHKSLRDTELH